MKVPADCIMVQGQDTICTEGDLTGEPFGVEKIPINQANYKNGVMCTMFAKSLISQGRGKALVVAVGSNTIAGGIMESVQVSDEPT